MLLALLVLLSVLVFPSLAFAHPGHGDGATLPDPATGLVLVGVTLGLAVHAWNTWGKRRPAPEPGHVGSSQPDTDADEGSEVRK